MADEGRSSQLVNIVSFALPAKEFVIECEVTENKPLPVVEEMVARLLWDTEELPTSYFQKFFGLTDYETDAVLAALEDHRMATLNADGRLVLTQIAREAIRRNPEGLPRLLETSTKTIRIAFDLATFSPVLQPRGIYAVGLPELMPMSVLKKPASEMAKGAVRSHFNDLRVRFSELSKSELYKVIRCEPSRPTLVPINVAFSLSTAPMLKIEREILPSDATALLDNNDIEGLLSRALTRHAPSRIDSGIAQFAQTFGDDAISRHIEGTDFDLEGYVRAFRGNRLAFSDKKSRPLLGPLYIATNRESIDRLVRSSVPETGKQNPPATYWLAPETRYWAATTIVSSFIDGLQSGEMFGLKDVPVATFIRSANKKDDHNLRIRHNRRLPSAYRFESDNHFSQWEILWVPERFAAVMCHIYLQNGPEVSIPVGHITSEKARVDRVGQFIKHTASSWKGISPLWDNPSPPTEIVEFLLEA